MSHRDGTVEPLVGTIAVTDLGWYQRLHVVGGLDEVNFWKPSATRTFRAARFSPFLFKLRAPHDGICGFGFFASYSRLPDWLAWEVFGEGNGCASLGEMRERIRSIRERIHFRGRPDAAQIGCILIVNPMFFPPELWVHSPRDWPARTQSEKRYDLARGEGERVWEECLVAAERVSQPATGLPLRLPEAESPRYGMPVSISPRLGQGTFRIAVTDAYQRACAVTGEHSLPVLDAAHIKPFADGGPHEIGNGLLLRADLHRLFDKGYLSVDPEHRLVVSARLREDYDNGRSYYPLHGSHLSLPDPLEHRPDPEYLEYHRSCVYRG